MHVINVKDQGLVAKQPEPLSTSVSVGGLFQGFRRVVFHYDPVQGTRRKYLPCTMIIAGASAAGVFTLDRLAKGWNPAAVRPDTVLTDRLIALLETAVQENPLVFGAVARFCEWRIDVSLRKLW